MLDDYRRDFEIVHGLMDPLPEAVFLGRGLSEIKFCNKLAEPLEHYVIEVFVVLGDCIFLIF